MNKSIVVDVEADGQIPHLYSMVCFGAVVVEDGLKRTFYGKTAPISINWNKDALAISGFSREEHENFPDPDTTIYEFSNWLHEVGEGNRLIFFSDNNGFDWSFMNYYLHRFTGNNPFGWSSRRIGDLYCGMKMDARSTWKHLRNTKHTHNPVDDAKGNAEVLLKMRDMGLKIKF